MRVTLVAKPGGVHTGVGRYVRGLERGLRMRGVDSRRVAPVLPPLPDAFYNAMRRLRLDIRAFMSNYPVAAHFPTADVCHLTSQNLASLLIFRRRRYPTLVTVHDIIPYMLRDDPELGSYRTVADRLFDRLAIEGLKRADCLIADSQYTRQCVIEHVGIAPDRIEVVHLGIDHERFRPHLVPPAIYDRYRLGGKRQYLIYVGSEDPRKNLGVLLHALAELRRDRPDVELIKVGRTQFEHERQRLNQLADQLGLAGAIHFYDDVPDDDLPLLYNLADVCVMPSLYEGFGFPALEAMACGTPVVCARAASLPELVGDAALMFDPRVNASHHLAQSISQILNCHELASSLRQRGLERAAVFQWSTHAQQVVGVYQRLAVATEESRIAEGLS